MPAMRAGPVFAGSLVFENVSYAVKGKTIINGVSLRLEPGRSYCLLGASGSGKTTLLRLAAGIERPATGRILLDGREVAGAGVFVPPERRSVGLMFQDFALFPHLTALENVAFGLTALKRSEAHDVARLALARVGLAGYEGRYPTSLSGGEQQRVALARAIVPRPQIILMDEPFSSLDQQLKERVRADTTAILRETRATSLLVTHDPQEALAFADEIFVMKQGHIIQQGAPVDFLDRPATAEVAQMFRTYNLFDATVKNGLAELAFGALEARAFVDGAKVRVLVPPGDIGLSLDPPSPVAVVVEARPLGDHLLLQVNLLSNGQRVAVHIANRDHAERASLQEGRLCGLVLRPGTSHLFAA